MAKSSKKIALVAALVTGLAAGVNSYAQSAAPKFNPAYWTADGVLVTPSIVQLSRDNDINVDTDLISGGNVTSLTAPDPINVVKDKIYFLKNSQRAKQYYTEEARQRQIVIYEGLLQKISSEKRTSEYYQSVKNLADALKNDHVLTRKELEGIVGGFTYAIDKKGKDAKVGNYDAPMLVTFPYAQAQTAQATSAIRANAPPALLTPLPPANYNVPLPEKPDVSLITPETGYNEKVALPVPEAPKEAPKQEKDYRSVYLLVQGTSNKALDTYGASIGARVNPFKNVDLGFGANLDLGFGLDKLTDSYNDIITERLSTAGSVTETNQFSVGGSLEAQFGPFIFGGGIDYKNWIRQSVAQIIKDDTIVKSNMDSIPNRQVFGKVYGGIEFPLGDNFKLGATIGYNWKDSVYFGIRTGIRLK